MTPDIEKQFDRIDSDLTALLEKLKDYSHADLNRAPAPGKWSPMQTMQHLILAEGYALQYLQKKLSSNRHLLKNAGIATWFRNVMLKSYMKTPFKFNAPDAVGTSQLPEESSFWEAAKKWKQQRSDLREFFATLPPELYKKEVYKHPIAGRLKLKGVLDFYESHFKRHRRQIDKALYYQIK
ncbi:MAG: DinB family protein [Bacteroidota bacterium]